MTFQTGLARRAEATALFDAAFDMFGKVDIFISTAGKIIRKPLAAFNELDFDGLFNLIAKAAFAPAYAGYAGIEAPLKYFGKALAKELRARGSPSIASRGCDRCRLTETLEISPASRARRSSRSRRKFAG